MASVEYQVQNTSGEVKYDAFPFVGTDKSFCDAVEIDFSDIIKSNGFHIDESDIHSDTHQDVDKNEIFYALLSDTRKDNQLSPISPCKVDVCLSGHSEHRAVKGDLNPSDFLDFTPPDPVSKPMKFKDISECEGDGFLSDLLSPLTNNPSNFYVSDDKVSLSDICIPELRKNETATSTKQPNVSKELSSDGSAFNLSDILSSLSASDGNQSKSSPLKNSSVENSDKGLSLDDFKISNPVSLTKKNHSTETNQENLSDIFSSLDISNLKSNKLDASRKSNLSTVKLTDESSKDDVLDEGFFGLISPKKLPVQEQASFNNFNINDFGEVGDDDKRKEEETQNMSPSNMSFSQILDKNSQSEAPRQEYYSSSGDSGISGMDFLSSVENLKEDTSTSEDDSDIYSFPSLSHTPEVQGEELNAVDLKFCIKTFVDQLNIVPSSIKVNFGTSHHIKRSENENPDSQINPLPLKHSVATVTSHKRMKQSLFSKSFGCKSKRDPCLIHKVVDIKADLLNRAFKRSTSVNFHLKAPLPNVASYSDISTTSNAGRRLFDSSGVSIVC